MTAAALPEKRKRMGRKVSETDMPPPDDQRPGSKLKRLVMRRRKGRDMDDIATDAGMRKAAFWRLLNNGIENPGVKTVQSVCRAVGATLADYDRA